MIVWERIAVEGKPHQTYAWVPAGFKPVDLPEDEAQKLIAEGKAIMPFDGKAPHMARVETR
jgi:hypothetical protein